MSSFVPFSRWRGRHEAIHSSWLESVRGYGLEPGRMAWFKTGEGGWGVTTYEVMQTCFRKPISRNTFQRRLNLLYSSICHNVFLQPIPQILKCITKDLVMGENYIFHKYVNLFSGYFIFWRSYSTSRITYHVKNCTNTFTPSKVLYCTATY